MLTILVYHYVREPDGRFPAMRARAVEEFEGQLDYVERHYEPVSLADVAAAYGGGPALPERALLLTFDDALRDHRDTVVPSLLRRGLSGCFAAAADSVLARRVLDVQKVQFALAAEPDRERVLGLLFAEIERVAPGRPELAPAALRRHAAEDRFDDPDTILVKRLLRYVLPEDVRRPVVEALFAELVTVDERAFADELYLSLADLRELRREGMAVAGHGVSHRHLGRLAADEQRAEIAGSVRLLGQVEGFEPEGWTMCFPSGSYDATTLGLLRAHGCRLGLTVEAALAGADAEPLALPRLDTNDLPLRGDAEPAAWTLAG